MNEPATISIDGYTAFKGMLFAPGCPLALNNLYQYLRVSQQNSVLQRLIQDNMDRAEALEYEFNRLCIGPYKIPVPPYESVFISGRRQLMTDETLSVMDAYQQAGLVVSPSVGEPADFIGTELEFMGYLESLMELPEIDELAKDSAIVRQQADDFLLNHLGKWYQEFTKQMIQHCQHPFWAEYAAALCQFLDMQIKIALVRQHTVMNKEETYDTH